MNYIELHSDEGKPNEYVTVLNNDGTFLTHNNKGMPYSKGTYERSILNKNIFIIKYNELEKNNSGFTYYDLDKGIYIGNSIYELSENYTIGTVKLK
jgi:hypothetical protein